MDVKVTGGFLKNYQDIVAEKMLPYMWEALNDKVEGAAPSGAVQNLEIAAGLRTGEHVGCIFQDSDLAKWLEACAFSLTHHPDPKLEENCDHVISLMKKAQMDDGYLNTAYQLGDINKRFTNLRDDHELYCAGHFIEAAVAYSKATGKDELIDIVCGMADCIGSVLGREDGKKRGYPGHPEMELALVKLYRHTGNEKYKKLAEFFVDERGTQPHYYDIEAKERGDARPPWYKNHNYNQSHLPVREQKFATGHAVRALYLYSSMADLALENNDKTLLDTCHTLWDNIADSQLYITGGVGQEHEEESFSLAYDLPGDTVYAETCASIALMMFAQRMLKIERSGRYADVMERAFYNTVLASMNLEGTNFFYVNPLEADPGRSRENVGHHHVLPVRPPWFPCACCPPNLARVIAGIGSYLAGETADGMAVYLYGNFEANLGGISLEMRTDYPISGKIQLKVTANSGKTLYLRIPEWCPSYTLTLDGAAPDAKAENGFLVLPDVTAGEYNLNMSMPVRRVYANAKVRQTLGQVALQRGPIVYCLEEADNGKGVTQLVLPDDSIIEENFLSDKLGGIIGLKAKGYRLDSEDSALYSFDEDTYKETAQKLVFIPYHTWANRGANEMTVWVRRG